MAWSNSTPTKTGSSSKSTSRGRGQVERLTKSEYGQYPFSLSPDGEVLFFVEMGHPDTGADLWTLSFDEDPPRAAPLQSSSYDEGAPAISPDGRWLAYESMETGRLQVVVQPYPAMDRKWPVSVAGGETPVWHPRGESVFFFEPDGRLMEAKVRTDPSFSVERPRLVLAGS